MPFVQTVVPSEIRLGNMLSVYDTATIVKKPLNLRIERYNVTTMTRVASGKMTGDFIANKRKFFFTYPIIDSRELELILDLIYESTAVTGELFFKLYYTENNIQKEAVVYVGAIPTELARTGSLWYWKNVSFNLIEQ